MKHKLIYFLVERKKDKKKFVMYGHPCIKWKGYLYLFELLPKGTTYRNAIKTPFGSIFNVDCNLMYNRNEYNILCQM